MLMKLTPDISFAFWLDRRGTIWYYEQYLCINKFVLDHEN